MTTQTVAQEVHAKHEWTFCWFEVTRTSVAWLCTSSSPAMGFALPAQSVSQTQPWADTCSTSDWFGGCRHILQRMGSHLGSILVGSFAGMLSGLALLYFFGYILVDDWNRMNQPWDYQDPLYYTVASGVTHWLLWGAVGLPSSGSAQDC